MHGAPRVFTIMKRLLPSSVEGVGGGEGGNGELNTSREMLVQHIFCDDNKQPGAIPFKSVPSGNGVEE